MLFSRKRDELRTIQVERVFEFMTVGDREMNGRGCLKFCAEKKSLIIVNFPKHSQVWGVSKQTLYFQQVLHACSVCHFSSWITSLPTCCVCLISLLIMFHFFQLFSSCVRSVFVPNVLNLNCSLLCLFERDVYSAWRNFFYLLPFFVTLLPVSQNVTDRWKQQQKNPPKRRDSWWCHSSSLVKPTRCFFCLFQFWNVLNCHLSLNGGRRTVQISEIFLVPKIIVKNKWEFIHFAVIWNHITLFVVRSFVKRIPTSW